ncbi:MAG: hypothetical protein A3K67_05495 [Euryarchaeota archaeon RBG_16_62_10]|nr:MAG: hypothetical protein A3K67_05495 [Euryarchaeota archaeon RBG_16_62_10]
MEEESLLCDTCADACFMESRFFLNPVLVGPSLFTRLRSKGSAACLLGPNAGSDIARVPSADLQKVVKDMNIQVMSHEDLPEFFRRCNAILAHLGVPLKLDTANMLLTEDATDTITTIVQKVNGAEKMYPLEAMSDLYVRVGVVYWSAAHSILFRTASKRWRNEKRSYLVTRAKEYFSKVNPGDELFSIAARNMGMLCLDAEEWTAAEENLATALQHFPNDLRIAEGVAKAHLMLGNQMEALSRVDDIITQGERPELWVLKGRIMRELDRSKEALECFNNALSLDPRYLPAHDILIETLRDVGRMEEAALAENQRSLARRPELEHKISEMIADLKKATQEEPLPVAGPKAPPRRPAPGPPPAPEVSRTPVNLAREAVKAKDYDTAIQRADNILKDIPHMREATLVLVEALVAKGDLAQASARLHGYYERNRNDSLAWYWRGVIAVKQDKWGAAVQYLSKAVSLDSKLVDAWALMGEVLLDHDKSTGADESFSRALQIDDANPKAWLGKAKTMRLLGRWGAAVQCLDRYISLEPGDRTAWLLKADILFEKEKYERAVEAYDKYMELSQDDSYALGKKGIALNALGMTDEARKALEESVRLDANNKEAVKWLRAVNQGGAP